MSARERSPQSKKREKIKLRAKKKGVPFNLTSAYIEKLLKIKKCPVCKSNLSFKENHPNGFSLDQIYPGHGYVKGNVAVLCRSCNTLKSNHSSDYLKSHKRTDFKKLGRWSAREEEKAFCAVVELNINEHLQILFENGFMQISPSSEFKTWFKKKQNLKRWSNARFHKWLMQTYKLGISKRIEDKFYD